MKNSYGTKPVYYLLAIAFVLGLVLSTIKMILPAPAYASSGEAAAETQSSSVAAKIYYLCDGGKTKSESVSKFQADWGLWNTVRVPFRCVMLTSSYAAEGYELELENDYLPGQNPNLPMVADLLVKVVKNR